jgi:hypothetical protein
MIRIAAKYEIVGVTTVGMLLRLRGPSRSRNDYHWSNRNAATWRPKGVGIGWRTTVTYFVERKSLFFRRFVEDASACVINGQRRDAAVCLLRAAWISPAHGVRHARGLVSVLRQCLPPVPRYQYIVSRRRRVNEVTGSSWPDHPRRLNAGRTGRPSRTVAGPSSNARP